MENEMNGDDKMLASPTGYPDEYALADGCRVHAGYAYVKPDGNDWIWFESDISGTVRQLARYEEVTEIRRCNIAARQVKP